MAPSVSLFDFFANNSCLLQPVKRVFNSWTHDLPQGQDSTWSLPAQREKLHHATPHLPVHCEILQATSCLLRPDRQGSGVALPFLCKLHTMVLIGVTLDTGCCSVSVSHFLFSSWCRWQQLCELQLPQLAPRQQLNMPWSNFLLANVFCLLK